MASDDSDPRDDGRAMRRLRDPYLLLFAAFRRGLHALSASYEWFEDRPGWLRFFSGVGAFLFSVYFGDTVQATLDRLFATVLTLVLDHFAELQLRTWLVLLLLVALSIQSTVTNQRVVNIVDTLNVVEQEFDENMGTESEPATDGGRRRTSHDAVDRTISYNGAFLGTVFGAIFGAMFGLVPMIGGAFSGAMFGHELEKCAIRTSRE